MARPNRAEADDSPIRLDAAAALRATAAFAVALGIWFAFSAPYERTLAAAAEILIRAFERPAATSLAASAGEIRVERADFPPDSPRPGLPAADLHFNFALLAALFALSPRPLRSANFGRFWVAAAMLWVVHVAALVFQVESVYATRMGPWSQEHYGPVARNVWAAGFHFYQILGRFAAPFVLWWGVGRVGERQPEVPRKKRVKGD
ncbi:MAG TPA: hypothetical protein VGO79_16490 [Thermoanaerobaculia bacterium]